MRLVAILFMMLMLPVQPALAALSPEMRTLEQRLSRLAAERPGDVGIAALDLSNGELVAINGDRHFPMASTMKIAVAANYLAQVDHGRRSLDDRIGGRSARSLMDAMIRRSDNRATDVLIRDLGGPAVLQSWLTQHGFTELRIDRNIAQLLAAKRDLWDVRDSSTPKAMVELLAKLDSGRLVSASSRAYLLDLMARCVTGKNRIRGLLPASVPVENKTGTLSGFSTDVGYLTLGDGRRVAVAFFARGGGDRARTIAEAAYEVYYGFAAAMRARYFNYYGNAASATR